MVDKFQEILRTYWGYPDFRGIQRDIIESIAQGEDTLGLMPTGGGKSITFQVPALAQKGVCIVVTPLRIHKCAFKSGVAWHCQLCTVEWEYNN